jgi:hypothetical protein
MNLGSQIRRYYLMMLPFQRPGEILEQGQRFPGIRVSYDEVDFISSNQYFDSCFYLLPYDYLSP